MVTEHPPKLLDLIARGACSITQADCSVIYPFQPGKMVYDSKNVASFGLFKPLKLSEKLREEDKSLAASVVKQGERVEWNVNEDPDEDLATASFVQREQVQAFAAISLNVGNEVLGVLFFNYRKTHRFTDIELDTIRRFANLAAFAILNARLYQRTYNSLQQRLKELETIQEIDDAISKTLKLPYILNMIIDSTLDLTRAAVGHIQLVTKDGKELELVTERGATLVTRGARLPMGEGVTGKAAQEGKPYRIHDILAPEWCELYRSYIPGMRSELAVPMRFEDKVVGVINIESETVGAFDEEDERLVKRLAAQAAIAIHNAKQYEELQAKQDELMAAGSIAWMGLFGSEWSHTVAQKTYTIRTHVKLLRNSAPEDDPKVKRSLDAIDAIAQEIQEVPLTIPSPPDAEKKEPIAIDSFVERLLGRWCAARADVDLRYSLNCHGVYTSAEKTLLQMALQKLVDNALRSMADGGVLYVATKQTSEESVVLTLRDTGTGIPPKYRPLFGRRRIPKPEGEPGSGMGGLLAGFILRKFEGDLELVSTERGQGTTLRITLPVFQETQSAETIAIT